MKMSQDLYDSIEAAVRPLDVEELRSKYQSGNIPRADKVQNINMRYRWDLYWMASRTQPFNGRVSDEGLSSEHIDTALRRIVKEL